MSGDNDEYLGGKSKRPRSLKLKKPMKKPMKIPMKIPTKKALLRKNLMKYFGGFFSEDAPTMPPMPQMPQMPPMPQMPSGETMGGYRSKKVRRPKVAGPRPRMGRSMRRRGGEGESGSYLDGPMNIASKIFDPTMGSITKGAEQTYQAALGNLTNVINGGRMRSPKRRAASPKRRAASPKRRAALPKRRAALPKRRSIMVKMM
jgi:hypothetical protein